MMVRACLFMRLRFMWLWMCDLGVEVLRGLEDFVKREIGMVWMRQ